MFAAAMCKAYAAMYLLRPRPPLERLDAVEHQEHPLPPDEPRQPLSLVPGRPRVGVRVAEPPEGGADELVGRGGAVRRPLAVERPAVDPVRPAPVVPLHPPEPVPNQGALPHAAEGDDGGDVRALGPAGVQPGRVGAAAEDPRVDAREPGDGDLARALLLRPVRRPTRHAPASVRSRASYTTTRRGVGRLLAARMSARAHPQEREDQASIAGLEGCCGVEHAGVPARCPAAQACRASTS
jgi:hypothetical protein